jgi:hypothetical protein
MNIHGSLAVVIHWHPAGVITEKLDSSPLIPNSFPIGEIANEHGAPPCMIMKEFPPMLIEPFLGMLLGFAPTEYANDPLPVPFPVPPVRVIHESLGIAFHIHPASAVTVTLPLPPLNA